MTRFAPVMRDADPNGAHRIAKRQWHDTGAIVLLPDQIARLPWQDRELVQGIAAKQYGPRNGAK
jgi:hypothetical protein